MGYSNQQRTLQSEDHLTQKPKTRDCKTNEVMEKLSALKPRLPVLCPERLLFDMRNGTWLVETIRASGQVHRVNRPDTRLHLTMYQSQKRACKKGAIHTGQSAKISLAGWSEILNTPSDRCRCQEDGVRCRHQLVIRGCAMKSKITQCPTRN